MPYNSRSPMFRALWASLINRIGTYLTVSHHSHTAVNCVYHMYPVGSGAVQMPIRPHHTNKVSLATPVMNTTLSVPQPSSPSKPHNLYFLMPSWSSASWCVSRFPAEWNSNVMAWNRYTSRCFASRSHVFPPLYRRFVSPLNPYLCECL
jgi:hypothetical protein